MREDKKIVGVLSNKEIANLSLKTIYYKTVLRHKRLDPPKWDDKKSIRDNFVIIHNDQTLEEMKTELEKQHKKFAVILDSNDNFMGLVDYHLLFGKQTKNEKNKP